MPTKLDVKKALDKIICKSRVHFYKPIQIAEILYKIRVGENLKTSGVAIQIKPLSFDIKLAENIVESISNSLMNFRIEGRN